MLTQHIASLLAQYLESPARRSQHFDATYRNIVRSAFQTSNQTGTFKCARARCKVCPFICNVEKLSGPKRSIKITDHFTCTSTNVIYSITCTLCKKFYALLISCGAILNIKFMTSFAESNLSSCADFITLIAGHRQKKSTRK